MADPLRLGAVILTGGTAARMDGVDKASVEVDGVTLLERSLHATMAALDVVVVGDPVPTSRPATFTREDPPHGGPAAGLLAGLDRLRPGLDLVCALAVDMPRVEAGTVARLTWAVEGALEVDGACLVDATGRRGRYAERLAAYGRGGEPCPRCGRELRQIGGREATTFCRGCQPPF